MALAMVGCGSASNDDQGVSFTNLGFFSVDTETNACEETGVSSAIVSIGTSAGSNALTGASLCIGLQNNLSGQFIRSERATITYSIPGAALQPPSAVVPVSAIMGPGSAGASTSLPDGVTNESRVISGILLLPAETLRFLSVNRGALPRAPYTMVASAAVTGVTSAGDSLETNPAEIAIQVTTASLSATGSETAIEDPALFE